MVPANVKLSKNELSLVCDESFILTKNNIIHKVYQLFGALSETFKNELSSFNNYLDEDIIKQSPKIYKGEQYEALPYVMLDYPRMFNKTDAFAIRCFFWWGNFFSITIHLEGKYVQQYAAAVTNILEKESDWFYCINKDKWQHHFNQSNYMPLNSISANIKSDNTFFKVAKKIPLQQWDDANDFYINNFKLIFNELLKTKK